MSQSRQYPVQFTGEGSEYFLVWIVNVALTLVTFGIYSAWAKVRTQRWFYGHTRIDDQAFSYLASPIQILKGRVIAVAAFALYYAAVTLSPIAGAVVLLGLLAAMPWVVVTGLRFAMRQSAYRGQRFDFTGSVSEAARIYIGLPLLIPVTLGLILPYLAYRHVRFLAGNIVYGDTRVRYEGALKPYWGVYLLGFALILIPVAILAYAMHLIIQAEAVADTTAAAVANVVLAGAIVAGLTLFPFTIAIFQARTTNLLFNASALGPVTFAASQRGRDLMWIHGSNLILVMLTLGLFMPWAKVRLARYRADHLVVVGPEVLDSLVAAQPPPGTATGTEIDDLPDLDLVLT